MAKRTTKKKPAEEAAEEVGTEIMTLDQQQHALAEFNPELAALMGQPSANHFGNMAEDDKQYPRLDLQQSKSPLVEAGDARVGQVLNSIDGFSYLDDPKTEFMTVIPIYYWQSRLNMRPFKEGGGVVCRSEDAEIGRGNPGGRCEVCPLKEWKDDEDDPQPDCSPVHNFVLMFPTEKDPERRIIIWSMMKTAYKVGTKFLNRMRGMTGPLFMRTYQLGTYLDSAGAFTFWSWEMHKWEAANRMDLPVMNAFPDNEWKPIVTEAIAAEKFFRELHEQDKLQAHASSSAPTSDAEVVDIESRPASAEGSLPGDMGSTEVETEIDLGEPERGPVEGESADDPATGEPQPTEAEDLDFDDLG